MKDVESYDIIIIGAGAAGLMAALELGLAGKSVKIVEARSRYGGRIHTITDKSFPIPIELGAEFVHGQLPITEMLLHKAGGQWHEVKGSFWQHRHGKLFQSEDEIPGGDKVVEALQKIMEDIPIAQFLNTFFPNDEIAKEGLKSYIEGYYAGDISKVSTLAVKKELEESDEVNYRIEGGYKTIIDFLIKQIQQVGCTVDLETPVTAIEWNVGQVVVVSERKTLQARKVIITVPLGVLQVNVIRFYPVIPQLQDALDNLGYGAAIKILLSFETPIWHKQSELKKLSMLFSDEIIPTWWTQYPEEDPVLIGWAAGGQAKDLVLLSEEELLEKALQSLAAILNTPLNIIQQQLKGWQVHNWYKDPYTRGAYSYDTINDEKIKEAMKAGIDNTLFFAGEGWFHGLELGTVEAALNSGRATARHIIEHF